MDKLRELTPTPLRETRLGQKKIRFWKKVSNYSIIFGGILYALLRFFKKELQNFLILISVLSLICVFVFVIAEVIKFYYKRTNHAKK